MAAPITNVIRPKPSCIQPLITEALIQDITQKSTMDYNKIKKLDEESLRHMTEAKGPTDKCICDLLYTPETKRGFKSGVRSIKKALASIGGKMSGKKYGEKYGQSVEVPLTFTKGGKGVFSTKETVKRKSSCGKCGCDDQNIVLKHSMASIRIVTPDISSICPCPEDCLPDKDKIQNNIKVTIEHVKLFSSDDESDAEFDIRKSMSEPKMMRKTSLMSLVDEKYDEFEYESSREDSEDDEKPESSEKFSYINDNYERTG